jgi:hypothetical protein
MEILYENRFEISIDAFYKFLDNIEYNFDIKTKNFRSKLAYSPYNYYFAEQNEMFIIIKALINFNKIFYPDYYDKLNEENIIELSDYCYLSSLQNKDLIDKSYNLLKSVIKIDKIDSILIPDDDLRGQVFEYNYFIFLSIYKHGTIEFIDKNYNGDLSAFSMIILINDNKELKVKTLPTNSIRGDNSFRFMYLISNYSNASLNNIKVSNKIKKIIKDEKIVESLEIELETKELISKHFDFI